MKLQVKRLNCQICGTRISPGGVFYIGRTVIISGSDGILPDADELNEKTIAKALHEITVLKSEEELMEEVYQEIRLVLCGRCRNLFRDKLLDMIKY